MFDSTSADMVERCRALVAEIDKRASETGAYEAEKQWTAPSGHPVYPAPIKPKDITAEFLADIPERAPFFTGWPADAAKLTAFGTALWMALRPFSPALGVRILARWWHRLQQEPAYYPGPTRDAARALARRLARQLPVVLRPSGNFDGTDMDRLALCERLAAMHSLGVFRRLAAIDRPVILEIGAGYGMLAAALLRALPEARYVVLHLPSSLVLSGCYLASRGFRVSFGADSGIRLALPADLPQLQEMTLDLAVNTLSFAEMPSDTVGTYAGFLRQTLTPDGVLFEQNFDNSYIGGSNFCDPTPALQQHLTCVATAPERRYLKGRPRVWVRS
jgi:hypothetical protein